MAEDPTQHQFQEQLSRIRRRRALSWVVLWSFPLVFGLVSALGASQAALLYGLVSWWLAWVISGLWVNFSRCPRCGKFIHWGIRFRPSDIFGSPRCYHCDLSLSRS